MLSDQQRRQFVRDGYLVIEDGIDRELVDAAFEQIVDAVPEDVDDPEQLRGVGFRSPDVDAADEFAAINDQLYAYGRALVGEKLQEPGPSPMLKLEYPKELRLSTHLDRRPHTGHLDGFGPGFKQTGQYTGFGIAGNVYFDDVPERGGGFTVWPGSHWVAADYFSEYALNTPGQGGQLPAIDDDGGWDRSRSMSDQLRSRELNAPAGTVTLWHNKLTHTAGVNQSDRIRMAGITRMRRTDHDEILEDAADKPFKYWDGVADLDVTDPRDG